MGFVENEKIGAIIPLNNMNGRLQATLSISLPSVKRLKEEMRQHGSRLNEERKVIDHERQRNEN